MKIPTEMPTKDRERGLQSPGWSLDVWPPGQLRLTSCSPLRRDYWPKESSVEWLQVVTGRLRIKSAGQPSLLRAPGYWAASMCWVDTGRYRQSKRNH